MANQFTNYDDVIDSRDVIKRIEELEEQRDGHAEDPDSYDELDDDEVAELAALKSLASQAEGYAPDWNHGETLIRDSHFEDYARELAEELHGDQIRKLAWPFTCIDWEQAATDLRVDYTSVEFYDVTYWIR